MFDELDQLQNKQSKKSLLLLKYSIPWSKPSDVKYNLHLSTVLSIIFPAQVWHADTQLLKKLENFQKFRFHTVFVCRLFYSEILNKYKNLPQAYHIQLSLICMFVALILGKYIFNHSEYVPNNFPPRENMRRKGFNPIKFPRGSTADDSFVS